MNQFFEPPYCAQKHSAHTVEVSPTVQENERIFDYAMTPYPMEPAVLSFVQLRSCGDAPVSLDTLIFDELQIDGIDAFTFMDDFFVEFDVNVTGYEYERYAMSEADLANIFKTLWRAVFNRRALVKTSFPVRHLVAVAKQGQWFDYHNSAKRSKLKRASFGI